MERQEYMESLLSDKNKLRRDYSLIYNELYCKASTSVENSLLPLKQYYQANPKAFNSKDFRLNEKAQNFFENMQENLRKSKESEPRQV